MKNILWAEDEKIQMELLRIRVSNIKGYNHDFASTSHQLIHKMAENEYDLLITDRSILYYKGIKLYEEFKGQKMWLYTGDYIKKTDKIAKYFEKIYSKPFGLETIIEDLKKWMT